MNRMNLSALSGIEATLWRKSWRTPKQLVDGLDQLGFDLLAAVSRRLHRRLDLCLAGSGVAGLVPQFMILSGSDPGSDLVASMVRAF